MSNPHEFITTSLNELHAIKHKLSLLDKMATMAADAGMWSALAGIREEEARLNELRKAYFFYE
ncbi:hypothetical protein [Bacillus phage Hakuna]|uniref:Uncharacterized protein n=3 Tax=Wphvirus TaxID=1922327 RepID=A0A222Z2T1_9CAUD|nr:hypothetical protein FP72_gp193 [Bacillus phage Hakuna]YP_009279369.1 hypothetical protein BIZ89_gp202 [Bacillus phage Kida]YP_009281001.1 hypothetical protein SAGEFAYGE_198 [Bacillus phage SageFayge]ASR78267.1 hypothetical protein PPISBEST_199 [Bacillus phage PPIsBest]QDH49473.1 hypothetical protein PHIREBALL_199 [Bacillus phage Phireball]QDH50181.1 hypothetical protein ALPS_195 [Bacillus phage ALPS]AHZ10211.1 hypothetical protein [Bacillus phage Hakuna]AMW63118.1 hypothetical protein SA